MARFTLCFILLAAALGHAIQPRATLDQPGQASNLGVLSSQMAATDQQPPIVLTESRDDIALSAPNEGICYKIRAYIFKRDDDHAPRFVRSTTCGPDQPHAKDAVWPKAQIVPAD
jgi:hypothetical protein